MTKAYATYSIVVAYALTLTLDWSRTDQVLLTLTIFWGGIALDAALNRTALWFAVRSNIKAAQKRAALRD